MRTDSNAFLYAVATIILAHFVIGFIWLWRKMNKKKYFFERCLVNIAFL